MSSARWKRVPAPIVSPPDSREDPPTSPSASATSTLSAPLSRADSAAARPAAPDPTTRTSTSRSALIDTPPVGNRCLRRSSTHLQWGTGACGLRPDAGDEVPDPVGGHAGALERRHRLENGGDDLGPHPAQGTDPVERADRAGQVEVAVAGEQAVLRVLAHAAADLGRGVVDLDREDPFAGHLLEDREVG